MAIKASDDFNQNNYFDCQTLSVLYGILKTKNGPEFLESLITKQSDGSYIVKFPGYKEAVIVTAEKMKDPDLMKATNPELIAIEQAFLQIHKKENSIVDPQRLLMGKDTQIYGFDLTRLDGDFKTTALISRLLPQAEEKGAVIVGATHRRKDGGSHLYTLVLHKNNTVEAIDPYDTSKSEFMSQQQAAAKFVEILVTAPPGEKFSVLTYHDKTLNKAEKFANEMNRVESKQGDYSVTKAFGKSKHGEYKKAGDYAYELALDLYNNGSRILAEDKLLANNESAIKDPRLLTKINSAKHIKD